MAFHFPKGNGIKIISQVSEAVANAKGGSMYILPVSEDTAELIIVSKTGKKRTIGLKLPTNMGLVDEFDEGDVKLKDGNTYLKTQVDTLLSALETAISTHTSDKNNPHVVTKSQVGLSNVDNTSDADKPISNAQQTALDLKIDTNTDDSLSIEGNVINSNVSMMSEDFIYSSSSSFQLGFEPSTIIGVFVNGVLLNYTEYSFDMNKTITVSKPLVADDFITIKYYYLLSL